MFREMRRKRQKLSMKECEDILTKGSCGVLSLCGDDGYPYGVPISYVYDGSRLIFHSAAAGHKIDAIIRSPKASFCVIDQDQVVPEKYTTYFRSVIVFGTVRILKDEQEKREAVEILSVKYAPEDSADNRQNMIEREWNSLCMLEMSLEHVSGKQAIELVP